MTTVPLSLVVEIHPRHPTKVGSLLFIQTSFSFFIDIGQIILHLTVAQIALFIVQMYLRCRPGNTSDHLGVVVGCKLNLFMMMVMVMVVMMVVVNVMMVKMMMATEVANWGLRNKWKWSYYWLASNPAQMEFLLGLLHVLWTPDSFLLARNSSTYTSSAVKHRLDLGQFPQPRK